MFKNNVFKTSVDTEAWFKCSCVRAIKTMAQAAIGAIGASVYMGDVNWSLVCSSAILAGVLSMLTSVAGIPEVEGDK